MSDYFINVHARAENLTQVQSALTEIFGAHGFLLLSDEPASVVVDDEDRLPEGEDWYGVISSSRSGAGWASVYVEDWQDSGVLARELSLRLGAPTLEVWVAEETHWGYNYFENGAILDRFADDPEQIAETPAEAAQLVGHAEALASVLRVPATDFAQTLRAAQTQAGEFAGPGVDGLAQAVGLPFEHVFIGYEAFFEDDPEDYAPSLERWPQWRHLAFRHPAGQETLTE